MRLIKKLLLSLLVCVVTISSVCVLDKHEVVVQTVDADNYYNINLTPDQIKTIFTKLGEEASMSALDVVGGVFQVAAITVQILTALGVFDDPEEMKYQNLLNKLDGIYNAVKDVNDNVNRLTENINTQLAKVIGSTEKVSTQLYVDSITNFESKYETPLQSAIDTLNTEITQRAHNWYDNNEFVFNQYLYDNKFRFDTSYVDYANGAPGVRKEVIFETNGDTLNTYRIQQERTHIWRDASRAEEYIKPIFANLFDNYIRNTRTSDGFYEWLKVIDVGETNPFVGFDPITQRRDMIAKYNELSDQQKAELREKFAAAGYESLRKEAMNRYTRTSGYISSLISIFKAYCDRLSESNEISGEFKNSPLRDHYNIYKNLYGFQGDLNFTRKAKVYDENGKETGETKDVTSNLAEAARTKYITNLVKFGTFVTVLAKESGDVDPDKDLPRLVYEPWSKAMNEINIIYNDFYKIYNGTPMDDWCYITNSVLRYESATVSSHAEIIHDKYENLAGSQYDKWNPVSDHKTFDPWTCSVGNGEILDNVGVKRLYARAQALYGGSLNLTAYLNKNLWKDNRIPTPDSKATNDSGYQATYIMTHFDGGRDFKLDDHVEMRVHKIGIGDWFTPYDGQFSTYRTNTDSNINESYYLKHDAAYGQFTSLVDTSIDADVAIARRAAFARDKWCWYRAEMAFMWDARVDSKHIYSDRTYDETWIHQGVQYYDKKKTVSEYCSTVVSSYNPNNGEYSNTDDYYHESLDIKRNVGILRIDNKTKPTDPPKAEKNALTLNASYPNTENDDNLILPYTNRTNEYGQTILLASEEPLSKLVSELTIQNVAMKELDGKEIEDLVAAGGVYNEYLEEIYKNYSYDKDLPYPPYVVYLDDTYKQSGVSLSDAIKYLFEKDEGAALYNNLVKMSLDYNRITEGLQALTYKPLNIEQNALKALIARVNEDNNNPENLVAAVFDTIAQRDKETKEGVQEGTTCYVSSKNKYYKFEDGKWSEIDVPTTNISNDAILEYKTSCLIGFEVLINENGDIDYQVQPVYDLRYRLRDVDGTTHNIDSSLLQEVEVDKVNIIIPLFDVNNGDNRARVEIYDDRNYFVDPILTTGVINTDNDKEYLELSVGSMGYPLFVAGTYKKENPTHYEIPVTGVQ